MSKSKWWKNKETGEVVLQTGSNRQNMGTVFYRVRSGETFSETKSKFFSSHTQIEASGFPTEKPKEFKPRYAVYDHWSDGEAFVMEFEPGKFKVVLKDGQEFLREGGIGRYFARLFEDGSWKVVSEEEALARLDKPKSPVPAAEQSSAVLDVPKKALKPKKKVLVEWAVLQSPAGTYRTELWPESITPLSGKFKTGRTVEVPE